MIASATLAALRDQPELFGPVASTPTAWRVVERLAQDPDALARLRAARAHARGPCVGGRCLPEPGLLIIDADVTLVLANTDAKEGAAGTDEHSFGFRFAPLLAYLDRGHAPREPLGEILPPGNAAAGAANDLIELRSDSAAASTRLAWHLRERGVGFSLGSRSTPTSARRSWPSPSRAGHQRSTPMAGSALAPRCAS